MNLNFTLIKSESIKINLIETPYNNFVKFLNLIYILYVLILYNYYSLYNKLPTI